MESAVKKKTGRRPVKGDYSPSGVGGGGFWKLELSFSSPIFRIVLSEFQEKITIITAHPYCSYHPNNIWCPLPVMHFLVQHISPCKGHTY
jgi:hypothetical protein